MAAPIIGVSKSKRLAGSTAIRLSISVAVLYFFVALWLLPDYGATWDTTVGEFPYGDRLLEYFSTGDDRYLDLMRRDPEPRVREPHPDYDLRRTEWYVVHPFAAILSGASCKLFWTRLGWLDAQSAHHLPTVVFTALLVAGLTVFTARRFGVLAALAGGAFLVSCPRFFAHSFFNLKDVPECALYTGAVLTGYLALVEERRRWWILAGVLTGLALAQKANALFIPAQLGLFYVLTWWATKRAGEPRVRFSLQGLGLAGLAFFAAYYLVSPNYWQSPIEGPSLRIGHMLRAGNALFSPVAEEGVALRGSSLEAALQVSVTTPLPVLGLALLGLAQRKLARRDRLFLTLGLAIPIGRNLIPGMANYDGVRHFLEFLPILAIAAGLGFAELYRILQGRLPRLEKRVLGAGLFVLAVLPSVTQLVRTHPFGIAYYNVLVGGLAGAQERNLREATDYWGSSYKQGIAWLNENAEEGGRIYVPIAEHVARSARKSLRGDLRFWNPTTHSETPSGAAYVMYITRRTFYKAFVRELEQTHTPLHEIFVQGGVILRIYRIDPAAATGLWNLEREDEGRKKSRNRLWVWLKEDSKRLLELNDITVRLRGKDIETIFRELEAFFPPELASDIRPAAEYLMPGGIPPQDP